MSLRPCLLFLLLLLCLLPEGFTQKILALENPKKFKRIIFQVGDPIRFGTDDSQARFSGMIESVDDSVVVIVKAVKVENEGDGTNNLFRDYVPIREITVVYNLDRDWWYFFRNAYSGTALIGGGALVAISVINALIENQNPDPASIIIASGISASGLLARTLGRNKYKLGKQWRLRAMEPMILDSELPPSP